MKTKLLEGFEGGIGSNAVLMSFRKASILFDYPLRLDGCRFGASDESAIKRKAECRHPTQETEATNGSAPCATQGLEVEGAGWGGCGEARAGLQWTGRARSEEVDFGSIDAVFISSPFHMLALPFLTEYTAFSGQVYATHPCIAMAEHWMAEVVEARGAAAAQQGPPPGRARGSPQQAAGAEPSGSAQPSERKRKREPPPAAGGAPLLPRMYTRAAATSCLSKVCGVAHAQEVSVAGGMLSATAHPTGSCLGSACWRICAGERSVLYISSASVEDTPAIKFAHAAVRGADAVLFSPPPWAPSWPPPPPAPAPPPRDPRPFPERCNAIADKVLDAVSGGGNVLVPVEPTSASLILLESICIHSQWGKLDPDCKIPVIYIHPSGRGPVANAHVTMEYCHRGRQTRVHMKGKSPFKFDEKQGRLRCFKALPDVPLATWLSPAVVLCPLLSAHCGTAYHLLQRWQQQAKSLLVCTHKSLLDCLPFPAPGSLPSDGPSHHMQVVEAAVEVEVGAGAARQLVSEVGAGSLVAPQAVLQALHALPPQDPAARVALAQDAVECWRPGGEAVGVPLPGATTAARAAPELLKHVQLQALAAAPPCADGTPRLAARVHAQVLLRDGSCSVEAVASGATSGAGVGAEASCLHMVVGQPKLPPLLAFLPQVGFEDVEVQEGACEKLASHLQIRSKDDTIVVKVKHGKEAGSLVLTTNSTHVISDSVLVRHLLMDAVLHQLQVL